MSEWFNMFIGTMLAKIVFRIMGLLGFTMISYIGLDALLGEAKDYIEGVASGLPAAVAALMAMSGIDIYISLVLSAYVGVALTKPSLKAIGIV